MKFWIVFIYSRLENLINGIGSRNTCSNGFLTNFEVIPLCSAQRRFYRGKGASIKFYTDRLRRAMRYLRNENHIFIGAFGNSVLNIYICRLDEWNDWKIEREREREEREKREEKKARSIFFSLDALD